MNTIRELKQQEKYNNMIKRKNKEIERLNNIIDELEKMLIKYFKDEFSREVDEILNKVQELKGDSSNE